MTDDPSTNKKMSWWEYWPVVIAVFVGQFGGLFLARWMAFHYAEAIAGFVGWTFLGLVWMRRLKPRFGIPRWAVPLIMGTAMALILGLMSYLFPWR